MYVLFCFLWSTYNIPDSTASDYLTTNTSNFRIDKYYVTKKKMVFLTLALLNKSVKFGLKAKHFFFIYFLKKKEKDRYVSHTRFTFYSKSLQLKYIIKSVKKGARDP